MKLLERSRTTFSLVLALGLAGASCSDPVHVERPPPPPHDGVYGFVGGCYVMDATPAGSTNTRYLEPVASGAGFHFSALDAASASRFFLQTSDLGSYLFYDAERRYLVADGVELGRHGELSSDVSLGQDDYESPAEWEVQVSVHDPTRLQLRHRSTGYLLGMAGLVADEGDAAVVALYPATGCTDHPELTSDAVGEVEPRKWDDGSVFGVVDAHSHLFTNAGFGGGGIFHGAPFHRLGVEHALPSCEPFHGEDGRADLVGYAYDEAGELDTGALAVTLLTGLTPGFNHDTDGYPLFTRWPNARNSSTHQAQYYKWLERAYLGGLRLMVQHATSNSVLCELVAGATAQTTRYDCNDMVAVDRTLEATRALERYIDAQRGGPGKGWFRVVTSPAEARQVIDDGKLAVILGIEVSNLFDCFLTPPEGFEPCDEAKVRSELDRYYERGVRVIFPVHKYDNAFAPGDGQQGVISLGNLINSGHYSNFTEDCDPELPTVFDKGRLDFSGLNQPRDVYASPPPLDMSGFAKSPTSVLLELSGAIGEPPVEGDFCQNAGLQPLGETLVEEMMERGMILEIDHLSRRSYARVFELLEENAYPAAGTHGNNNHGRLYALGGVSATDLGRCQKPGDPHAMAAGLHARVAQIEEHGGYPAEGFSFDLNGFAHAPGPRFGPESRCEDPQTDPVTYPFTSYAGDVVFHEPQLGDRTVDFNTEGFVHIGMMAELIEDARRGGVTDEDLEPLFRSAEAYLRMWERSEARGAAIRSRR